MNKDIKLLIENLFDDSDNIFVNDKEQEYNDIIKNNYMIKTKEQLYNYIVEKYNVSSINVFRSSNYCPEKLDLRDVIVPENFDTTRLFAFFNCKEIDISTWKITELKDSCFSNCFLLSNVKLPNKLKKIGKLCFNDCIHLYNINIPESVIIIDDDAFGYTALSNIILPDNLEKIGIRAFQNTGIKYIELPETLTSIGTGAFCGSDIVDIEIPDGIKHIESITFADCEQLKTIYIPSSVKKIDFYAFENSCNINRIYTDKDNIEHLKQIIPPSVREFVR